MKQLQDQQRGPMTLRPIRWGKPDLALASAVCTAISTTTPPPEFDGFNPLVQRIVRDALRRHNFTH